MSAPLEVGGSVRCLFLPADPLALRQLTDWVTTLLTTADATALQSRAELAVHEVCMNVIDHAYGPEHVAKPDDITVDGAFTARAVTVRVRDAGIRCDQPVGGTPTPKVPTIRGYGLVIVEKLVDELTYQRMSNTNLWSLRFDRPAASPDTPTEQTS